MLLCTADICSTLQSYIEHVRTSFIYLFTQHSLSNSYWVSGRRKKEDGPQGSWRLKSSNHPCNTTPGKSPAFDEQLYLSGKRVSKENVLRSSAEMFLPQQARRMESLLLTVSKELMGKPNQKRDHFKTAWRIPPNGGKGTLREPRGDKSSLEWSPAWSRPPAVR